MNDNTSIQFRLRLAQINGINMNEEQIDEAATTQSKSHAQKTLTDLWHEHSDTTHTMDKEFHTASNVKWWGLHQAASDIEKHVRKHYGPKVVNAMKKHSKLSTLHSDYSSEGDNYGEQAKELRKKHSIGER